MKTIQKIILAIVLIFFLWVFIDAIPGNNLVLKYLLSEKDCGYRIPSGYMMVVDDNGNYAMKDTSSFGDRYLTINVNERGLYYKSIIWPITFKDSCRLKGFLKRYLLSSESYSDSNTPFKRIK